MSKTPKNFKSKKFTNAEEAVQYISEIYSTNIAYLQEQFRNFAEAVVFSKGQNIYAQTGAEGLPVNLSPEEVLKEAERGKVVLMTAPNENRVRALVELEGFEDSYLYVARMADPTVLSRVNLTRAAAEKYEDLQNYV